MNDVIKRVDEITHVSAERFIEKPSFPKSMKIEITSRCNYKCTFCALKSGLRDHGNINVDFLHRLLREAKFVGVREVGMFLLGESMIVKELDSYIEYAKKEVEIEYVFLTTNGYFATLDRMISLIDCGLDSIKFSINAPTREKYYEMHGVDAFDRVIENLKLLSQYKKKNDKKISLSVSSIYVEENAKEFDSLKSDLSQYVDCFYYLPFYNQAGHVNGKTRIVGNPGRYDNMVSPIPCWELFNAAKVTWDGWMTACCFDHNECFKIADLTKTSLMQAWHHSKFIELRKVHLCKEDEALKTSLCSKCLGLI